ncbi:hypothetical protein, partial [Aquidulcibacter sp.]|uniref:hypothetical protein n=1 Tax=Aquidulcibacter sp. TaxID=2052990 RepID=UPI003BA73DC1
MVSRFRTFAVSLTCLALSVGPAFSDSTPAAANDPMVAYRAYDQAVAEGKLPDAAVHAKEAWKRA